MHLNRPHEIWEVELTVKFLFRWSHLNPFLSPPHSWFVRPEVGSKPPTVASRQKCLALELSPFIQNQTQSIDFDSLQHPMWYQHSLGGCTLIPAHVHVTCPRTLSPNLFYFYQVLTRQVTMPWRYQDDGIIFIHCFFCSFCCPHEGKSDLACFQ